MTDELARQRRRRAHGTRECALGLLLVALCGLAVWRGGLTSIGSRYVYFGVLAIGVVGYVVLVIGCRSLLRYAALRPQGTGVHKVDVRGGGFRSFVAWRYLMARDHRISRPVAYTALAVAFVVGAAAYVFGTHVFGYVPVVEGNLATGLKATMIGGGVLVVLTLLVGYLRYVFSFFTTVPLVGVWIGTAALVIVLSVMSGFETDLRQKILGSNAHIQITREDGGDFTEWHEIEARIDKVPGVIASTPYVESEVVIAANQNGLNVIVKGIDPKTVGKVTDLIDDLEGTHEDKLEAMTRLEPLIKDAHETTVPQPAPSAKGSDTLDPAPPDMPSDPDPVDYSQPTGSDGAAGADDDYLIDREPIIDPAPADLVTSDEAPIDFGGSDAGSDPAEGSGAGSDSAEGSGAGSGSGSGPVIHTVEVPFDTPSLGHRTQALPGIFVGRELVKQTHVYVGQEVHVVSPLSDPANPDATGTPIPFNRDYRVAGIFFTGMYEYDLKHVYVTLDSLQAFLDRGDTVDGIEVRVTSPDDTDAYVRRFQDTLGPKYRVQDWKELNRSLFSALKLEKIAMFVVLGIVILVASFSIVGNLIMVVVEKQREIALLKTLGASDNSVMQVFAIQGLIIGAIGTAIGVSIGLIFCWCAKRWGIPLDPNVYYIDRMPIHVDASSVITTAVAGIVISMAATFYPALLAARVRPAAGMRH